jgi:hypothetical protein
LPDGDAAANVSLMWLPVASSDARASFALHEDAEGASHGARFQRIAHKGGEGAVGVANYGLNCQHGMVFIAGRQYEGYTHLRAMHAPARGAGGARGEKVNVTVALHDWQSDTTLASSSFQLAPERGWVHVPLDFTPSANTTCGGAFSQLGFCGDALLQAASADACCADVALLLRNDGRHALRQAQRPGHLLWAASHQHGHRRCSAGRRPDLLGSRRVGHGTRALGGRSWCVPCARYVRCVHTARDTCAVYTHSVG